MYELNAAAVDDVAGGFSFGTWWTWAGVVGTAFNTWEGVMSGVGGTLNNYYGQETTLEIINGGNLGA